MLAPLPVEALAVTTPSAAMASTRPVNLPYSVFAAENWGQRRRMRSATSDALKGNRGALGPLTTSSTASRKQRRTSRVFSVGASAFLSLSRFLSLSLPSRGDDGFSFAVPFLRSDGASAAAAPSPAAAPSSPASSAAAAGAAASASSAGGADDAGAAAGASSWSDSMP